MNEVKSILKIEKKDIVIVGVPFDANSSFMKGSSLACEAVFSFANAGSSNWSTEAGIDVGKEKKVKYFGKIETKDYFGIENEITKILERGAKIISIGGDHSITFPIIKAFSRFFRNIEILHFDAHPDLYAEYDGNPYSHACTFARITEERLVNRVISLGVRASTPHQNVQAKKLGVEHIRIDGIGSIFKLRIKNPLYISIDIDSLDPAFAPGVSHPEPGGLSSRELLNIIQKIEAPLIIGADIVEFNPLKDINEITSSLVFKILKEIVGKFLSQKV